MVEATVCKVSWGRGFYLATSRVSRIGYKQLRCHSDVALCSLIVVHVTNFHSHWLYFWKKQKLLLLLQNDSAILLIICIKRLCGIKLMYSRSSRLVLINLQCMLLEISRYIPDVFLFRRCINSPIISDQMRTRSSALFAAHISEKSDSRSRWILCGPVCAESHCGLSSLWT